MPLAVWTAVLMLLIAALAGINLWFLVRLYEQTYRSAATFSTLQYGLSLCQRLAQQPLLKTPQIGKPESDQFTEVVESLATVEPGLAYVSVREHDVVVYHRQMETQPDGGSTSRSSSPADLTRIRLDPKKIYIGSAIAPVMAITCATRTDDGRERDLQIALKKDLMEQKHAEAMSAVTGMFRMSLVTLGVSFGLCLLAVLGLVHREMRWQKRRRQDEHLAFAGAMAGSILHDFRNPMSAMRLDSQLLHMEAGKGAGGHPTRLQELAGRINRTIDRLDDLLKEFLAMSRPEMAERERVDLQAALLDCLELLKLRFEKAGIRMVTNLPDQRLSVRGFPVQFKRALLNILNNAEQFSPPDSTVSVTLRQEGKQAVLEIADEGPGIPFSDRKRIFDLFFSRRPGGTGIGLALAKAAIENCGGTIDVQDGYRGKGSCFVIRIPIISSRPKQVDISTIR